MEKKKIHNKGQARLFKNKYLEMLTKTHPLVIWGMYIPIIGYFLYYAHTEIGFSISAVTIVFFIGMAFWSFFEYIAHRYIFHWISEKKSVQKFAYTLHGNHHEYPRDRQRLFMPPIPSLLFSAVLIGIFYLVMREYMFAFYPGFILGYLLYASMHYAIHAWAPPFKWMKPLWRNHHLHHYKNEEKGFGVSSTVWDHVFGTTFDLKSEKDDQDQVKKLMFDK
jgi:sterol desaturase/sphingolipid hydroxylase (fatty acid hydroxylase superfamily)